jgi:hypothetical protein
LLWSRVVTRLVEDDLFAGIDVEAWDLAQVPPVLSAVE